jgi:hypothetical protein
MGLACPVCDVPHTDAEHLADHLAVTAMVRQGDHAGWLDEHAPDWADMTRGDLGSLVGEHAVAVDSVDLHEEVGHHEHSHQTHEPSPVGQPTASGLDAVGDLDADARAVLDEARKLTEQMHSKGDESGDDATEQTDDA